MIESACTSTERIEPEIANARWMFFTATSPLWSLLPRYIVDTSRTIATDDPNIASLRTLLLPRLGRARPGRGRQDGVHERANSFGRDRLVGGQLALRLEVAAEQKEILVDRHQHQRGL